MTERDIAARNSNGNGDDQEESGASPSDLGQELSRFSDRLASFGLGEALDALLSRRVRTEPELSPPADPA